MDTKSVVARFEAERQTLAMKNAWLLLRVSDWGHFVHVWARSRDAGQTKEGPTPLILANH